MTRCSHCGGTGRAYQRNLEPYPVPHIRKRMIPYGHAVEAAVRDGSLIGAPFLFAASCPHTGKDAFTRATEFTHKEKGKLLAMALPEGADASEFRYPALPVFRFGVSLMVIVDQKTLEQQHAIGNTLIAAGLDVVLLIGGIGSGSMRFEAT